MQSRASKLLRTPFLKPPPMLRNMERKNWSGFWRSNKTALLSRDSSRSDPLIAPEIKIMLSKTQPDLKSRCEHSHP